MDTDHHYSKKGLEITFLEDVLSLTNSLCLLLQSDKKDFGAISRSVTSTIDILNLMKSDYNSTHFKSFHQSGTIIEKLQSMEMGNTVAGRTRKQAKIDQTISMNEFHVQVIKPFIKALVDEISSAFDLSDLPILQAFLKLDPTALSEIEDELFSSYGEEELKVLHDFYGNDATDEFHGRKVRCDRLLFCPFEALKIEFDSYKAYIDTQKKEARIQAKAKERSLKSKLLIIQTNRYATKKSVKKIEAEIENIQKKMADPISVEDVLADEAVSVGFPNVRRLLTIYMLIPYTEVVVERGLSKMGQIMTKKRCTLDDSSLDILMRISYRKEPLRDAEIKEITDIWKSTKDRRIFSSDL